MSSRFSDTVHVEFLYVAIPVKGGALRLALPLEQIDTRIREIRCQDSADDSARAGSRHLSGGMDRAARFEPVFASHCLLQGIGHRKFSGHAAGFRWW